MNINSYRLEFDNVNVGWDYEGWKQNENHFVQQVGKEVELVELQINLANKEIHRLIEQRLDWSFPRKLLAGRFKKMAAIRANYDGWVERENSPCSLV